MADISLEAVTGKLNRVGYDAFIQALRHAKGAGNRNVELAHWLFHILQQERTDLSLTADHFKLDRAQAAGRHRRASSTAFARTKPRCRASPTRVIDMLDRGWHYATLFFGETQIRTGHLLVGGAEVDRSAPRAHQHLAGIRQDQCRRACRRAPQRSGPAPRRRTCGRWMARACARAGTPGAEAAAGRKARRRSTGSRRT